MVSLFNRNLWNKEVSLILASRKKRKCCVLKGGKQKQKQQTNKKPTSFYNKSPLSPVPNSASELTQAYNSSNCSNPISQINNVPKFKTWLSVKHSNIAGSIIKEGKSSILYKPCLLMNFSIKFGHFPVFSSLCLSDICDSTNITLPGG